MNTGSDGFDEYLCRNEPLEKGRAETRKNAIGLQTEIHSIEEFYAYVETLPPEKKKLADNWCIGIGLQDVDHLTVSVYLLNLARRNIEGELTIAEVEAMIQRYHDEKKKREQSEQ